MRQITALMPAKEAQRLLFICKRTERFILPLNKLAQIFALGSRFHFWNAGLWHGLFRL